MRKRVTLSLLLGLSLAILSTPTSPAAEPSYSNQIPLRADRLDIFFDPDFPIAESSLLAHYEKKNFVWVYREIIPIQVGGFTYFAILGSNGDEYPNYYGGIQFFKDGTYGGGKASIFSAWDPKKLYCTDCSRESENVSKESQVDLWKQGDRTVVRPFGNEGTGLNSMIHGFPWKLGEKVSMLASIEPAGSGSLITSAIRLGESPWELMTSFYVPARYSSGMNGNYAFLEDFEAPGNLNETVPRSFLVGPTYLEDSKGNGTFFTNVYVAASNTETPKITPVRHKVTVEGSWLRVESGIPPQTNTSSTYRLTLEKPTIKPNLELGKALIRGAVEGKSTRQLEEAADKAAADKAAADKAAADKAAADKAAADKAAADAKAAASKKTTITCVKRKVTKKVTAVNPKCPAGYKKK
jgi:hypothetical protein